MKTHEREACPCDRKPDLYALLTRRRLAEIVEVDVKALDRMHAEKPLPWIEVPGLVHKRITLAGWYAYIAPQQTAALHE